MTIIHSDSSISVSQVDLPMSSFLSSESLSIIQDFHSGLAEYMDTSAKLFSSMAGATTGDMAAIRERQAETFYASSVYQKLTNNYNVSIKQETLGGVYTEIFVPTDGVSKKNKNRVLINLHGGGFIHGARTNSHLESIPITAEGKIKIVSVDYRMAPECKHPAALEDAVAVYKALLNDYRPENIGIFGCSAGGLLTAQVISWLLQEGISLPGAVGMFCASAHGWSRGDSGRIIQALGKSPVDPESTFPYFDGVDCNSSLVLPGEYAEIMAKFPPSLLISSTRDFALSSVITTHFQLVKLGVKSELHVLEGLDHAFMMIPNLPETREVSSIVAEFFDKNLDLLDIES